MGSIEDGDEVIMECLKKQLEDAREENALLKVALAYEERSVFGFSEYQEQSARTLGKHNDLARSLSPSERPATLAMVALGIAGEAGEVAEIVKKHLFHGHPLDNEKLRKELGDVLWYLAAVATVQGIDLQDVADANVEKLRARYPNGFNAEDSMKRVDEVTVDAVPSTLRDESNDGA